MRLIRRSGWWLAVPALALAYYAAARLGLLLAFQHSNASPVWPPSGIALAALAVGGRRLWPGVALGAFAANAVVFAANGAALPVVLGASAGITVGNSLEAWLGATLLRHWIGKPSPFERLADVAKFIVIVALASAASAAIGTATLLAAGIVARAATSTVALTWWTGDATGMLVLAPLLMALRRRVITPGSLRATLPVLALLGVVAALGVLVFAYPASAPNADRRLVWLFMLCIAWAAYRHGPLGAAAATLLTASLAVWGTTRGLGPFSRGLLNDALIVLQTFVGLAAVTGLVLAADRRERQQLGRQRVVKRDLAVPWAVLLGCLGVAVVGWHLVADDTERRAHERFAYVAEDIRDRIDARMTANEQVLRGAVGLFAASDDVSRADWRAYVQQLGLAQSYPGIQALGFARWLRPDERAAHEQAVRAEGFADFAVRPAGERDAYAAIVYIEPFDARNRRAFGYDMFSEATRRAAMERARDSGEPALSGKVTLVQERPERADGQEAAARPEGEHDVQAGVLMYLPVYRQGQPVETVAQRRAQLLGFVYSPLRMTNLMRAALGPVAELEGVAVRLYSGRDLLDADHLLFDNGGRAGAGAGAPAFSSRSTLVLPEQAWTLQVDGLPLFESHIDLQKAQIVLIAGVGLSLLLFALVRALTLTRERALLLAEDMNVAVRDSQAQFRSLAESASEAIVIVDSAGRVRSWNGAAQAIFGHTEAQMRDQALARLVPARDQPALREGLLRVQAGLPAHALGHAMQLTGLHADGREFPIELSLASWDSAGGRFCSGIIRDITERERAAQALRDSEQAAREAERQLQAVLRASPVGVIFTDAQGQLVYGNPAYLRIAGLSLDDARIGGWGRAIHADDAAQVDQAWRQAIQGLASFAGEYRYLHADGRIVWARAVSAAIVEDSRTTGFVAIVEDISARVAADAELKTKTEALQRSNAELAQFAYVASHDLKEPLRTVASYSQLLLRRHQAQLSPEGQEFVQLIGEGAKRAQALVSDLLSLARLDSSAGPMRPVAMQAVFDDARRRLAGALHDSQARLTHGPLPRVLGDRAQLVQLLQNLIENGLKFHQPGQVPVVHVSATREADGAWRISVADQGIGIEPRFHEQIFTIFQRLHRAEIPGTGIGLAICKKVVERHGGHIGVESIPGQGATFFFTMAPAEAEAPDTPRALDTQ
ncbi:CHASE domain-containing protein [Ideonella sp.]|uniref:CHASE domain-containing protein n=1 Tax=Ideonella sp. TaxID=1929293 RepID=UPI0035B4CD51